MFAPSGLGRGHLNIIQDVLLVSRTLAGGGLGARLEEIGRRDCAAGQSLHATQRIGEMQKQRAALRGLRRGVYNASAGRGVGFCDVTTGGASDCARGDKGSWVTETMHECASKCAACRRCRYISFSLLNGDCSWFHKCAVNSLRTWPEEPSAQGWSYVTVKLPRRERHGLP